jgi:hypothetical protein
MTPERVESRNLRGAEMAARELGRLSLEDALGLCVLYLQCDPERYERAAVRWLERLIAERHPSLEEVGLAVAALAELRNGQRRGEPFSRCYRAQQGCVRNASMLAQDHPGELRLVKG